jgi:hypothetical protein
MRVVVVTVPAKAATGEDRQRGETKGRRREPGDATQHLGIWRGTVVKHVVWSYGDAYYFD